MKSAYKTSGIIFEQVSKLYQPGLLEQLRAIGDQEIVVVTGMYDHIEKLLDTLKVPYSQINSEDIASHNGGRVMLVNCKAYGTEGESPVSKKMKDPLREFVSEGGRLVTTDWALGLVTKTFPNKLKYVTRTSDDVVEVQAHTDIARRFMGLNYAQCHPQWWLEGSSHIFDVKEGVVPIIVSEEMKQKYGQPYIAVGFAEGKGEVFHFISHLELQRTRLKTKEDKGSLDDFLQKMNVSKTAEMDEVKVAELEAAYSTLNTLAHLCIKAPILNTQMKSTYIGAVSAGKSGPGSVSSQSVAKSQKLV